MGKNMLTVDKFEKYLKSLKSRINKKDNAKVLDVLEDLSAYNDFESFLIEEKVAGLIGIVADYLVEFDESMEVLQILAGAYKEHSRSPWTTGALDNVQNILGRMAEYTLCTEDQSKLAEVFMAVDRDDVRTAIVDVLLEQDLDDELLPILKELCTISSCSKYFKDRKQAEIVSEAILEHFSGEDGNESEDNNSVLTKSSLPPEKPKTRFYKQEITCFIGDSPDRGKHPEVVIPLQVYQGIVELCQKSEENEVGWFGTMTVERASVRIHEIFLPTQNVTTVTVDITGIAEIAEMLASSGRADDLNRLHFWGHCHPGSSVYPSSVDLGTYAELLENSETLLMGIFSADATKAYFRLHHYGMDILLGWRVVVEAEYQTEIFPLFEKKVKMRKGGLNLVKRGRKRLLGSPSWGK